KTTGKPVFEFSDNDDDELSGKKVVGYMAYFEYQNGFKKVLYWSKEKMLKHADQFSKAFSKDAVDSPYPNKCKVSFADYEAGKYPKADDWKYSSFWYKDFNAMALKTLIRQLISKWGIMSIDLQKAFDADTETLEKENDILPESPAEDQFFGNPEGLEKPDVVEVEEKVVPKSARGRKKKEVSIEDENPNALQDGFFEGGVAE
ncbi:MAG: recombinase RecT, partial [Clostridia bacterium]|nr:recombinase RecT [Clostridia bacterium]